MLSLRFWGARGLLFAHPLGSAKRRASGERVAGARGARVEMSAKAVGQASVAHRSDSGSATTRPPPAAVEAATAAGSAAAAAAAAATSSVAAAYGALVKLHTGISATTGGSQFPPSASPFLLLSSSPSLSSVSDSFAAGFSAGSAASASRRSCAAI